MIVNGINILSLASILIALAALSISFWVYRLSRKLPNENKIFEEKIRSYHALVKMMNETIAEILVCIGEYKDFKRASVFGIQEKSNELNRNIDDAIIAFEDAIAEYSLFLPEEILEKLYGFMGMLDKPEYLNKYLRPLNFKKLEEEMEDSFNEVVDAMRADLEFEELDRGLKYRLSGRRQARPLEEDE